MSLRVLITGTTGQIGWHLQRTLAPLGDVTGLTRDQLDLSDLDAVTRTIREFEPDILVNAAAYTAVDKAESEPELARTINALAPARMAEELARNACLLVHYSTDYVFDGNKPAAQAYQENDATGPLNVYGQTKLEGEQLIAGARVSIHHPAHYLGIRYSRQEFSANGFASGSRKGRAAHGGRPVRCAYLGANNRGGNRNHSR